MSSPAHRAFQQHFALDNNIGAVCAKEELFEVVAELCGLATSVVILQAGVTETDSRIVLTWTAAAGLHFTCRRAEPHHSKRPPRHAVARPRVQRLFCAALAD